MNQIILPPYVMNTNPSTTGDNISNSKGSNHQFLMIETFLKILFFG